MSEHINQLEWIQYFSSKRTQDTLPLRNQILTHVIACPECREFFDAATALEEAAQAYADTLKQSNITSTYGYQAVAALSFNEMDAEDHRFRVAVDTKENSAVFMNDTIEYSGRASQYAVNPVDNYKCLREDLGAFCLTLQHLTLRLHVDDSLIGQVCISLMNGENDIELPIESNDIEIPLVPDDIQIVELTFTE